ncbi:hypothetical protein SAMN05216420_102327 [Nitrosospira sp. Nl5]|nr:hypothetical protein SAMN05216420_102327 [Nitrosospira sp. Nl5]
MNMPSFTAEASLYKTGGNYRMRAVSGSLEKGLQMQALAGIRFGPTLEPSACQVICERFFENGVSFERCRIECPTVEDGGGDDSDCRTRCRNMGNSEQFCMRLCLLG